MAAMPATCRKRIVVTPATGSSPEASKRTTDELPMSAIGRALDLGAPAVSGLIERALKSGRINWRRDEDDGHSWLVSLTPAGADMRIKSLRGQVG